MRRAKNILYYKLFIYSLFAGIVVMACSESSSNKSEIDTITVDAKSTLAFINYQTYFIQKSLNDLNIKMPISNTCLIDGLTLNDIPKTSERIEVLDKYYIDPYVVGEHCVELSDYERRSLSLKMTKCGQPLKCITSEDKKSIALIYAGPDRDYDIYSFCDLSTLITKIYHDTMTNAYDKIATKTLSTDTITSESKIVNITDANISYVDFTKNRTRLPKLEQNYFISYDPTNGLISNGDIVWILRCDEKDKWISVKSHQPFYDQGPSGIKVERYNGFR